MKKHVAFLTILLVMTLLLFSCVSPKDVILTSFGEYQSHEFYTEGYFQDYTDYAKYYYDSVDFTDNEYFYKIGQADIDVLNEHLDDFESWIKTYREGDASREIVVNYDFDRSVIDHKDYLYIESEKYDPWDDGNMVLASYDVYFFDTQTNTLYYFHNNI